MYDIDTGVYFLDSDWMYEFETAYYLKYNIEKAKIAISNIYSVETVDFSRYSNDCNYYHMQIDLLLDALGQIINRFSPIEGRNTNKLYIKHRLRNRKNYGFDEVKYINLSRKEIRNFKVHIDEKNIKFIEKNKQIGGFNTIDVNTVMKDVAALMNFEVQNNTLDLLNHIYYVSYFKEGKLEKLFFKLSEVFEELERLDEINEVIWGYVAKELSL